MIKILIFLLVLASLFVYVLYDSRALEFVPRTLESSEWVTRQVSEPAFHWGRLQSYFNNLLSKISK